MLTRILLASARRSWRLQQALTLNVRRNGRVVPVMHGMGLGVLEMPEKARWFTPYLREMVADRPGVMVDVGANIGVFLLIWRQATSGRAYYGFEPHIACVHYMERVIAANQFDDSHILPIGLSDAPGVLTLASNSEKDVMATTVAAFRDASYQFRKLIPVERGDNVLAALGSPDVAFLKVDTEGAELEVLRGMTGTLKRCRPLLHLEVAPYAAMLNGSDAERQVGEFRRGRIAELEALLRQYEYRFRRVVYGSGIEDVETLHPITGPEETDFICEAKRDPVES